MSAVTTLDSSAVEHKLEERDCEKVELPSSEEHIESYDDHDVSRPFPIEPNELIEDHQLSFRAIVVGCALGAVVGSSNIYLGLKTGFTFGSQLFGAIFGYVVLKTMSNTLPESGLLGWLGGGPFGPKENCTVQSAATAAGGLGVLFVSGVPAMYRLGLLNDPAKDIGKLIALAACAGFFGVFFVIPLRKYFIIYQKLTFPTPAATAYTIRSLHRGRSGAIAAKKKSIALLYSFIAIFTFKILTGYAPGILYDWHIGWTLYRLGFTSMIQLENYGWILEFTPALFGAGMLSGLNASWSFFGGFVLAWGIIAPSLIKTGKAFGTPTSEEFPLVTYAAMSFKDPAMYSQRPSPRYWLLWPGVLMMLMYSFADVAMSLLPIVQNIVKSPSLFRRFRNGQDDEDPTPVEHRIPFAWWSIGLTLSTVMCCAILATMFHMNVGQVILALILGFLFSFIGVQSTGATDINPVSTVAKASQLVFGGISKGAHMSLQPAQTLNLTAGVLAAGAAAQSADMTGDLKTGYLLRAKPRVQFIAQLCGSVVAVFLTSGLYVLFTKASPCIITGDPQCPYGAPSVSAWAAVAVAVTSPSLPISPSSGYTAIGLGLLSVLTIVVRNSFVPKRYWGYVPNWNAIGLAFVIPQVYFSIAMAFGSSFNYFWRLRNPASYEMYMFAVSAGMLAGEGLGGVFQALLAVAGVDGSHYGTAIGCPANAFCG